jgi:hypothetical protein
MEMLRALNCAQLPGLVLAAPQNSFQKSQQQGGDRDRQRTERR